jgi:hypothetical protein
MQDSEITTAGQLDAELVQRSIEKHRKLWKATEGRWSWFALLGTLLGATLMFVGFFMGEEGPGDRVFMVGIGVFMILQYQIYWAQSKSEAIAELLKRLEQRVTHLEKKTFADG